MTAICDLIADMVESSSQGLRRSVQMAVSLCAENGLEKEVLRAVSRRNSVGARWLVAALTEKLQGPEKAAPLWERVVGPDGAEIPEVLLHRARYCARGERWPQAASLLRLALHGSLDHDLLLRAEALARRCKEAFGCVRKTRIAILGSSTTALFRSAVETMCLRDRIHAEFYEPPYGTYAQELMSPESRLHAFHPDFIVLLLNWRDLGLEGADSAQSPAEYADRIVNLWQMALSSTPAFVMQFAFTPPANDAYCALSSLLPAGKSRMVRRINEELNRRRSARVALIDAERLAASCAVAWEDPLLWSSAAVYPAPAATPLAAAHVVSLVRAELGMGSKLLLLDLDNTLWGGVIGEDGLGGIKLGAPSAMGVRYQEFQRYVKDLASRGVLLAVVSKNHPAEAESVFRRHRACVLKLNDFVSFKANWESKAANIRAIAEQLNLGIESFVLLDDNPAERAAVRNALPQMEVPEISADPADSIAALERGLYFQTVRLTAEDRARHSSYGIETRPTAIASGQNLERYLAELSMEIEYGPVDAETSARVTQLINKTNQFNLTTRRYGQGDVQKKMNSPLHWARWYRLRDRFADHGVIAVLLANRVDRDWSVDLWLMSCRVIGRGVEEFMFRDLVESAHAAGASTIRASYIPSARNQLVAQLLPNLGFVPTKQENEFILECGACRVPECKFLRPHFVDGAAQPEHTVTAGAHAAR